MATKKNDEPRMLTLRGTGTDPLGRYPAGHTLQTPSDSPDAADAIERGWAVDVTDDVSVAAKTAAMEAVHTPEVDDSGAVRQSRPFTPEEAAAIDEENRRRTIVHRAARFEQSERAKAARSGGAVFVRP